MGRGNKGKKGKKMNTTTGPEEPPQSNASANPSQNTICVSCNSREPDEWVVQCDECDRYFHYKCVGFKETFKEDPWSCPECVARVLTSTARTSEGTSNNQSSNNTVSEQVEPTSAGEALESNNDLRRLAKADFESRSLSLRQEFEQRYGDLLASCHRASGKHELVNQPKRTNTNDEQVDNRTTNKVDTDAKVVEVSENSSGTAVLRKTLSSQPVFSRTGSSIASKSSKAQTISSTSSKASSQRRREIEIQRLQEEYELQTKLDEEKLALERKALELKELREKKLIDGKFRAMEEIISLGSGSSVASKATVQSKGSSSKKSDHSKETAHSDLVSSWIQEQRKQNHRPKPIPEDVDQNLVTKTLGVDISIPVNERELRQIYQQQKAESIVQPGEYQMNSAEVYYERNLHPDAQTFIYDRNGHNSRPFSSFQPHNRNQNNPMSYRHDGQTNGAQISSGQSSSNHRRDNATFSQNYGNENSNSQPLNNDQPRTIINSTLSHNYGNKDSNSQPLNNDQPRTTTNPTLSHNYGNENSNSQPLGSNQPRISWNPYSQRTNQHSTQTNNRASSQNNANQIGGSQNYTGHQLNQYSNTAQSQSSTYPQAQGQQRLTPNQIAARHSMPKDLPPFYGHPYEWAKFIKRYENTSNLCGFGDSENLERLDRCLKGKAREIVESQLIMPDCVQEIIETLREKFGRPELIAKSTLAKIRAEPAIRQEQLEALSDFGYKVRNACNVIESMGLHFHPYNPELIQDIIGKLPYQTRIEWARHAENVQANNTQINLRTVAEWLHKLSRTLNQITTLDLDSLSSDRKPERKPDNNKGGFLNFHDNKSTPHEANQSNSKCVSCSKDCTKVGECSKFKSLSVDERWKLLLDQKLCRKCLQKHGRNCTNTKFRACGVSGCELKHHPLLHIKERHSKFSSEKASKEKPNPEKYKAVAGDNKKVPNDDHASNSRANGPRPSNTHQVNGEDELFRILPVILHKNGISVKTFAFLDEGSSYTLMEKETANQLNINGTAETICLMWTNGIHRQEESLNVNLEISGINELDVKHPLRSVNVVEDLGLATQTVDPEVLEQRFEHLRGLPLPKYSNAIPTILIGLKHIRLATPLDVVEGRDNEPIASRSRLGWSVYGPIDGKRTFGYASHHRVSKCPCKDIDDDLHKMLKDHVTIENFGVSVNSMNMESKENQKALEMLKKFTVRKGNRFETRLLWKNEAYALPDSYGMARKRLACVENKGAEVVNIINEIIADYLTKGYASKLSPADLEKKHARTFYLPIFTVTNPKKPGKIRPVFDAAATVQGTSLNSTLLTGPDLLAPLVDILRRFREHRVGVTGDIIEMFHQVLINEDDRHSQRFLWRNGDKTREPDVYQFNVMTFGSKCSPSSAQFVKNTNASEYEVDFPRAAISIIENHYVDDMLDGARNVQEAIKLINDVKFIHGQAGFEIRNFKSNSEDVLMAIGEPTDASKVDLVEGNTNIERVLGMFWETMSDCFMFSFRYTKVPSEILEGKAIPTKRELLRLVMSLFDPLELVSYYVIHAKSLLQDVWRSKVGWDEKLPENLAEKWYRWIDLLPQVERLKIPRWYSTKLASETNAKNELHIFVDAGDEAFAAVAYLRVVDDEGVDCSLIGSKARVTPLKYLSIPRKELMGGVLGSRLVNSVENGLSQKIDRRVVWTDSITVLTWLHSEHKKYSQFVAHRVGEILENTNLTEWRWVPTKLNVADEATKWSKKPTFDASDRWFTGPEFLKLPENEWPVPKAIIPNGTSEEMKLSCSQSRLIIPSIVDATTFSTWSRLVRAVANAKRMSVWMIAKVKKLPRPSLQLSQEDLLDSEGRLIRQAQWEGFTEEMVTLVRNQTSDKQRQKTIDRGSSIKDCSPYLDDFGMLRVKGRIDSATALSADAKRPIILPRDNPITKLIVLSYHVKFKHRNNETVINELRQRFYIPQIRTVLKSVRWNCKLCELRRCQPKPPQMADLPAIRFEAGIRPFTYTGIDYFGPLKVKVGRQTHKRWGVIFTCLTIRAIWIDVVPSLDTQAYILSIRDFVLRNGQVQEFYSDNGTQFKGADNELTREMQKLDVQQLSNEFTSCYTKWNFNPPEAAHMGGMWERLIRSVKSCLYESMTTRTPTDQVLKSWLTEAENIVNSRPLTFVPLDTEDDEALTPNHFIMGSSNGMKPPGKFKTDGKYLRDQWKEVQRCTDIFWQRFIHEYIPTLTRRTKWFEPVKPLEVGDIVISFDENAPRNTYTRARVVETRVGSNQQVRRAKVQFGSGRTLWRPATKLGLLDVNPAPTEICGLDHPTDDKNRGENVGATIPIVSSNLDSSNVAQSVGSVCHESM